MTIQNQLKYQKFTIIIELSIIAKKMRKLLTCLSHRLSLSKNIPENEPYFKFIQKGSQNLQMVNQKVRNRLGQKINVPHKPLGREDVRKFFQQNNLRQKNMIIDVDSSHLLGVRRMLILQHLKKNVYKQIQEPIQNLMKTNPQYETKLEQIFLDEDVFFMTDPKFLHLWQTNKTQDQIDAVVQEYYDKNIDRGVQRFKYDYKIPEQFLYIIQTAHNFDNNIYFGGINQYDLRNVVWLYHTVEELKTMFVGAMHHWKQTQCFLKSQNTINMADFNNKCREYVHQQNYHIFQPYRYNRLKVLRAKIGHSYTFAHDYAFHKAGLESMNIKLGKQHSKATESDKIQKHAILQVMLGNLWNQQYSNDKFPHLSENYSKLSENDKQTVNGIFNKHCNIYLKAIQKFRDKHYNEASQRLKQKQKLGSFQ